MCSLGTAFEGSMLAYHLVSNEAEWILLWGMVSDLSQAEEASARELSNMVPHNSDNGARRLDQFMEQRSKSGVEESGAEDNINDNDGAEEGTKETPHEEETRGEPMDQGYQESQIETQKRRVAAQIPSQMVHVPWHPAWTAHTPHTAASRVTALVVAAWQTSPCLKIEVT